MAFGSLTIIGVGGMGQAVLRRLGAGRRVLLADFHEGTLADVAAAAAADGYDVTAQHVDVSAPESVAALAARAQSLGLVEHVVHTAGVSPVQAPVDAVRRVDLLGFALVLEEFGQIIAPGGAGVFISSMSGQMAAGRIPAEVEAALATAPVEQLLALPFIAGLTDAGTAYSIAKRGNQLRVQAASLDWGARGARVNSISPGVISTAMGQQELAGGSGAQMRAMVEASATGRLGTPEDIANATAFLLSPDASFITGTDLLVDGGVVAALATGQRQAAEGQAG